MIQLKYPWQWRPIILVLMLAAVLYGYQLGAESLSIIESYSLGSAKAPLNHFNRPLYFVLLRGWMQLGLDDAWLRGLSVLFGLICVGVTYQLGKKLVNRTTGLMAALLLTLSPLAIYLTQEVRFYMMSACLGVAGSLVLTQMLLTRLTLGNFARWLLLRFLGVLTAQVNILLLVSDGVLLLTVGRSQLQRLLKHRYVIWILGVLTIPIILLAKDIVPPLIEFLEDSDESSRPGAIDVVRVLSSFTAWPSLPPLASLTTEYDLFFKIYALASIGLMGYGLVLAWRNYPKQKLLWAAYWGFLSIIITFIASQGSPRLWDPRYLFVAAPYVLIVIAAAIEWLLQGSWQRRLIAYIAIGLIAIATFSSLARYYTQPYREDWRGVAETIVRQEQEGDAIIVYPDFTVPNIEHYYNGQLLIYPVDLDRGYPLDIVSEITPQNLERSIDNLAKNQKRFWLVFLSEDEWGNYQEKIINLLKQNGFYLQSEATFYDQWDWGPILYLFTVEE